MTSPKLFNQLAPWWPLLSPPGDYAEEAEFFARTLRDAGERPAATLLELGSGGGNNASFLKEEFELTLVDPSPGMLAVSRRLNPDNEHVLGDMRDMRLGRRFDRVFIHDAICYMTTTQDLRLALQTAYEHLASGGAALFAPDFLRETFRPGTSSDGHDRDGRGVRYLEWTWDPDPLDTTYVVDYAFMLREGDQPVRVVHDRHLEGIFARHEWLRLLTEVGFEPRVVPVVHSELEPGTYEVFLGIKRGE